MVDTHDFTADVALQRCLPRLRAFIRLRTTPAIRARESCSDLVQSVCRELFEQPDRPRFASEAALRRWLFTKALDKIRDRGRYYGAQKRDARRERPLSPAGQDTSYGECYGTMLTPSRLAMGHEQLARFEAAFDRLCERDREVVTLSKLVGAPHAEIAAALGVGSQDVSRILHRALRKISWILSEGA